MSLHVGGARTTPGAGLGAASAAQIAPRFAWTHDNQQGFLELGASHFSTGQNAYRISARQGEFRQSHGWSLASDAIFDMNLLDRTAQGARLMLGGGIGRKLGVATIGLGAGVGGVRYPTKVVRALFDKRLLGTVTIGGSTDVTFKYQHLSIIGFPGGYSDAEVSTRGKIGVLDVGASYGYRTFSGASSRAAYQVQAQAQALPWLAVELAAGRSAATIEGYVEADYVTGGLRIAAPRRTVRGPTIERSANGARVTFAMSGRDVAIAGEWNDWTPVPLTRNAGGGWVAELVLPPGAHKFMLIVDGKNVVPAGVPKLPDGFGGEVGLLVL